MVSISKTANPNYLAKIIKLKDLRKHPNADRLQVMTIDFQNVILDMTASEGDYYVFFPLESKINGNFLSFTNSYRDVSLNKHKLASPGFFEKNGRVRAVKLRGEKSMGYVVPMYQVEDFTGKDLAKYLGDDFDTVGDILMVEKYVPPSTARPDTRQGKKPRISRLVDGQVHLHVDTENLRRNASKIHPEDNISITYKVHGTSFWVSNVLCKRKLNLFEKLLKLLGVKVDLHEYDYIYGSRKVVKNQYETQNVNDFYDGSLWETLKDEMKEFVPKNYTFYGECVGYTASGKAIQAKYDYGCEQGKHKNYIYRITFTNPDGIVRDLSTEEIQEWAAKAGFNYVPHYYTGRAKNLFPDLIPFEHWNEDFVKELEKKYNDKNCYICKNEVPEEGIVLRKESGFQFESYKLKSWSFLEHETKMLDAGEADIENEN